MRTRAVASAHPAGKAHFGCKKSLTACYVAAALWKIRRRSRPLVTTSPGAPSAHLAKHALGQRKALLRNFQKNLPRVQRNRCPHPFPRNTRPKNWSKKKKFRPYPWPTIRVGTKPARRERSK